MTPKFVVIFVLCFIIGKLVGILLEPLYEKYPKVVMGTLIGLLIVLAAAYANAASSSSYLTVTGIVKPIVTVKVTKESSKVYTIEVLSNNPNGFTATVNSDVTQPTILSVPYQTETKTYNYKKRFTSAPSFVKVSVQGD